MTAREYLSQATDIRLRIEANELAIQKCYTSATKSTASVSDIPPSFTGSTSHKVEDNVLSIVEHKQCIEQLTQEFEEFAYRATIEINKIQDNVLAALLINKYICGLTWEQVAEKIGKDMDYTRKELHSKALDAFEKYVPDNTRKNPVIPG